METPMNAAYGEGEKPKDAPRAVTILGQRIPGERKWMVAVGLFGVLVFLTVIVVFLLPSGIPFLAAKYADGFFSYVMLFFAYMFGFFFVLVVFFSMMAAVGLYANRLYG